MKQLFTTKPKYDLTLGGFNVKFYASSRVALDNYVLITTKDGLMNIKLRGYTYKYLLESANKGNHNEIQSFATLMYVITQNVYLDGELALDMIKSVADYTDRLLKKGADKAAEITEAEEAANQALMEDVAAYADAKGAKAKKALRKQWKKEVKQVINEDNAPKEA